MEQDYSKFALQQEEAFESLCKRCGECCGSLDDPCSNLIKQQDGTYYCKGYADRIGSQQTVSGKVFNCVSIREHIKNDSLRQNCAYRKPTRSF